MFQLPFEALTGIQNLAYAPCMVLLGLIFLAACFGVVGQAVRRWFPQASAAAYLLAVAAVTLGSQFYYLLLRPYIYEYAILCGAALLMLGLWLWLSAASTPVEKRGALVVKLVFGSLCVALVAGCRPQMELFAFLAVPIFWPRYIGQKRLRSRAALGDGTAAAALPALRTVMAAAVAYTAVYRFCTLFAMEPYLQGMNPSLYYTVSRLVQFWM